MAVLTHRRVLSEMAIFGNHHRPRGIHRQPGHVGKGDGIDRLPATMREILSKSLTVRGFIDVRIRP